MESYFEYEAYYMISIISASCIANMVSCVKYMKNTIYAVLAQNLFCCYFPCFVEKLFCDLRAFCVEKYLAKNLVHGEKRTNSRLEQKSK